MAFTIPTARSLINTVAGYFKSEIPSSQPRIPIGVEYVLSRVNAMLIKNLYEFISWTVDQRFPDKAIDEYFWRFASIWITRKTATPWIGVYRFTGTDTTVIPLGTQVERSDGAVYETTAAATIGSTTTGLVDVAMQAVEPTYVGTEYNNDDGQELALTAPISGCDDEGTVQSTTTAGTDLETRDEGYARLLQRLQNPPGGGGSGDYVRWALEVSGVTRAWEFANLEAPNSVSIAFTRDNESPIVPDAGERQDVLDYMAGEGRAPITVDLYAITLTENAIAVTLTSLTPNTAAVQAAIEASLTDLFYREGGPGETIPLSRINEAISAAAGETDHVMSVPSADVTNTTAQVATLGTVTYP